MDVDDDEIILQQALAAYDREKVPELENTLDDKVVDYRKIKNLGDIVPYLETFEDENEVKEWLRSPLFRPRWLHYYSRYYLAFQASQNGKPGKGDELKSVIKEISQAESGADRLYTRPDADTSKWSGTQWMAHLFYNLYRDNDEDKDGLFYGKNWSRTHKENLLWRLVILVKREHSRSHAVRNGGGYDLVGLDEEERQMYDTTYERLVNDPLPEPSTSKSDILKKPSSEGDQGNQQENGNMHCTEQSGPDDQQENGNKDCTEESAPDDVIMESSEETMNEDISNLAAPTVNEIVEQMDTLDTGTGSFTVGPSLVNTRRGQGDTTPIRLPKASRPNLSAELKKNKERLAKNIEKRQLRDSDGDEEATPTRKRRQKAKDGVCLPLYGPEDIEEAIWQEEIVTPQQRLDLTRISDKPNMTESFWQYWFISRALHAVQIPNREETSSDEEDDENSKELLRHLDKVLPAGGDHGPEPSGRKKRKLKRTPFKILVETSADRSVYSSNYYLDMETFQAWNDKLTWEEAEDKEIVEAAPIIVPTKEAIDAFEEQQQWFDNKDLQRENHKEACQKLGIKNPDVPKIPGMRVGISLYFWQPVAIQGLRDFSQNKYLHGCILGDAVGVGKTIETVGYLLATKNALELEGNTHGKPVLIIVPAHLVWQWVSEIERVTGVFKIYVYYGDIRMKTPFRVRLIDKLTEDHKLFDGKAIRNNAIIITSYSTLTQRHGSVSVTKSRKKKGKTSSQPVERASLTNKFRTVILDEAHTVRNEGAKQSQLIASLTPDFHVLLTATPLYNSIEDFRGLMKLILRKENETMWSQPGIEKDFNPFEVDDDHSKAPLRLTVSAGEKFIWQDNELRGGGVGHHIRKIWKECMIRRTLSSRLPFDNGKVIGDSIPPAITHRFNLKFHPFEQKQYKLWQAKICKNLITRTKEGRMVWNMAKYREMILVTTWLWFRYIHHDVGSGQIKGLAKKIPKGRLVKEWIVKAMSVENKILKTKIDLAKAKGEPVLDSDEGFFKIPQKSSDISDQEALQFMLKGSPKLRALVQMIRDEVLLYNEKSIVWCVNPGQQLAVAGTLALCGIDARIFHAELDATERQELITEFTTKPNSAMVLVCSYYVNSSGSNLQGLCRNIHLFDLPSSEAILMQAIGRVRRLGQKKVVKVYDYTVEDSFNIRQLSNNLDKVVPNLAAELNEEIFNLAFKKETKELDLGCWVRNEDNTLSHVSENVMKHVPEDKLIQGDDLIYALLEATKDGKCTTIRQHSDYDDIMSDNEEEA